MMSEAEEAWRLWHLLEKVAEALWDRYESAFLDFCGEEDSGNGYIGKDKDKNEEYPF